MDPCTDTTRFVLMESDTGGCEVGARWFVPVERDTAVFQYMGSQRETHNFRVGPLAIKRNSVNCQSLPRGGRRYSTEGQPLAADDTIG